MIAVPSSQSANSPRGIVEKRGGTGHGNREWVRIGAAGTLIAGALLLLSGKRRAGLLATAAGATLTALDQQETVKECWDALPGYLNKAQCLLDQAQATIDDIAAKRDKVMSILSR